MSESLRRRLEARERRTRGEPEPKKAPKKPKEEPVPEEAPSGGEPEGDA